MNSNDGREADVQGGAETRIPPSHPPRGLHGPGGGHVLCCRARPLTMPPVGDVPALTSCLLPLAALQRVADEPSLGAA